MYRFFTRLDNREFTSMQTDSYYFIFSEYPVMKHLRTICLLLVVLHLSAAAYPSSQIQRLARLVMPYVGGNHHSLALARSLDSSSSLARRHNNDDSSSQDVGATDFEDEDVESISKRQFDDYGHMRFGRNAGGVPHKKFDDYGHMRYGK